MLIVCTWANTVGALIPVAAEAVGIDPTVVSAPLITTLVDASGLFIYLSVAKLLIAQLHGASLAVGDRRLAGLDDLDHRARRLQRRLQAAGLVRVERLGQIVRQGFDGRARLLEREARVLRQQRRERDRIGVRAAGPVMRRRVSRGRGTPRSIHCRLRDGPSTTTRSPGCSRTPWSAGDQKWGSRPAVAYQTGTTA